MSTLATILAVIGGIFVLYWIASFLIGNLASKETVGYHYIKKRLKQYNIDPHLFDEHQLRRVSANAFHSALYSGSRPGKFDATNFKEELEFRIDLISRYVRKSPLIEDERRIIQILLFGKDQEPPSASPSSP